MEIRKGLFVLSLAGALIVGGGAGAYGDHYFSITRPQNIAMSQAQKQQEKLNEMVRHGNVTDVKPNQLTMKVTKAGIKALEGKTITLSVSPYCNIQAGQESVNKPGQPVDITKYLKVGQEIDVLDEETKGDKGESIHQAVAIHWNATQPAVGQVQPTQNIPQQ